MDRRLDPKSAIEIRKLYTKGAYPPHPGSVSMLAKKFNVPKHIISDIVKFRTYKNVTEEGEFRDE